MIRNTKFEVFTFQIGSLANNLINFYGAIKTKEDLSNLKISYDFCNVL